MLAYAVGIVSMLSILKDESKSTKQTAYADDLGGAGLLMDLRQWWNNIERTGPLFGYFPKASKSWLIVKDSKLKEAKKIFEGTGIKITATERKYLGGFIGNEIGLGSTNKCW